MNGRGRRLKGKRAEYEVRDYFRERGYESLRVPLSGASEGYKGDVVLSKNGRSLCAEVKSRKDEFASIYGMLDLNGEPLYLEIANQYVAASYCFTDLGLEAPRAILFEGVENPTREQKKLLGLKKWVKDCDFLVIKNDRRPFIFIRYF